jgi:hypothetical protein
MYLLLAYATLKPMRLFICERLHQSVGSTLRVFLSQEIPFNIINIAELVDSALATDLHVTHSTIPLTLDMTPGDIIFDHNMFLNIPLLTDFHMLQEC